MYIQKMLAAISEKENCNIKPIRIDAQNTGIGVIQHRNHHDSKQNKIKNVSRYAFPHTCLLNIVIHHFPPGISARPAREIATLFQLDSL